MAKGRFLSKCNCVTFSFPQIVTGHLLVVANIDSPVRERRWVPGAAGLDGLDSAQFGKRLGIALDQRQLAFFAEDDKQIVPAQNLAVAVARFAPVPLAGLRVNAGKESFIEPVIIAFILHGATELAAQRLIFLFPNHIDLPGVVVAWLDFQQRAADIVTG